MPTVQHFDIPIDDLDRDQKFYRDVFGWDMKKVGNPANT
ncbi:MAG: VOC family protein [Nitrosopumilus sp.]|nr:VOC family protein [Nitrosopumilus sp.]